MEAVEVRGFFIIMNRIYHPYQKWECFKAGFFNNITGINKADYIEKVVELFSNPELTENYMLKVIDEWKNSCEHNLSNNTMNRIAWLGQSACCLYYKIPSTITMEAWRKVPKEYRDIADKIALDIITKYQI